MTELLVGVNPDNPNEATVLPETAEEKARQLPKPQGYKILVCIPEIEETYESGILKADQIIRFEELLTNVLFVVELGPDCDRDWETN